ncbi:MAG: His/Gly/Thr/Pro-type tRNA ligase C-terminal domain-containing protein [Patescibacteria group bacterium]|nr:His/Gly/Thr/Pro-type tRNA ligase C-terminal domain-containing protein [Patescibacteria group bacterium]
MKQSQLFTKTERFAPKDEETKNAQLLTRAGFAEKLMAGVYNYLPLGLITLRKIERIVREEMNRIGGQEILMPMLHPKENWQTTGGWDKIDVLFKIKSRTEKDYALGQSEEEVVTPLVMRRLQTYKDLPLYVYQIHWKFRDELRAKSGLLRGREFFMKDMYSFHVDQADFDKFYEIAKQAYLKIFTRLGLTAKATEASGGSFSQKISYEFMVLTDAGEDDILYCDQCVFCVNQEIAKQKEGEPCPQCKKGKLRRAKAAEVGNVFDLGQKYGKDFDLGFKDKDGVKQYPVMGCYGIGISRLLGVIVEKCHDDKGIIWPEAVAPFKVHLLSLDQDKAAEKIYHDLLKNNIEVLYDDRRASPGEKFADADLIGLPYRLVVSAKSLKSGGVEIKKRGENQSKIVKIKDIIEGLK